MPTTLGSDARDIAQMVSVPQMLRHFHWPMHSRGRADCRLCRGRSKATVSFTERLWKCHRCQVGGNVFSLVMQTQRCDFPTALRYVADYAGIPLPPRDGGHNYTRQIERKRHQRERIERSGEWLAEMERSIRLQCRDKIHECDRILDKPGPWDEAQWQRARWALLLQREFLLPEYCLLAFGNMAERVRYVLASDAERAAMLSGVRERWGVNTESGHLMEVMG